MGLALKKSDDVLVMEKPRPHPGKLAISVTAISFLALYIPLLVVIAQSFLEGSSFTWRWYSEAFQNKQILEAFWNSLVVGIFSTAIATVIGTMAALSLERTQFKGKKIFEILNLVPLVMPEIVLGIALLSWYAALHMSLGLLSITLSHVTFSLCYVILTVKARLADFDRSLEEAARDLGASSWQCFWKVTFPLIWPGILSGALLAFTISFDDFLITFFTAGVGNDTLPVKLYSMIKFGINPSINAISTVVILVTLVVVLLSFRGKKSS